MSDNDEKKIDLDDLESETTFSSNSQKKIEEKVVNLQDIPTEKKSQLVRKTEKKSEEQIPLNREEMLRKLFTKRSFGVKEAESPVFLKIATCFGLALLCYRATKDIKNTDLSHDMLLKFGFEVVAEPILIIAYGMMVILVAFGLHFFFQGRTSKLREDFFVISYDGIEGVDAVIPNGKTYYRRKIRWTDITRCRAFENTKVPYIEICSPERKLLELPLHISDLKDFHEAIDKFCPVNNPMRLIVNKFKNP